MSDEPAPPDSPTESAEKPTTVPVIPIVVVVFIVLLGFWLREHTCGGSLKPVGHPSGGIDSVFKGYECVDGHWKPQWESAGAQF